MMAAGCFVSKESILSAVGRYTKEAIPPLIPEEASFNFSQLSSERSAFMRLGLPRCTRRDARILSTRLTQPVQPVRPHKMVTARGVRWPERADLWRSFPVMGPALNRIASSLQRSGTWTNSFIAALTLVGQQLFSSFAFRCPCQAGKNFYYGSAFLAVPALILLAAGYALRSQVWTISRDYCCPCAPPPRRAGLLERKLACLRVFGITGRALVAPLTWLVSTLMKGDYYECAASEFAPVDPYPVFDNISASEREEVLAGFPCGKPAPSDMMLVRDEVALLHRYQSQMLGWILITVATVLTLAACCVVRCCSPLTSQQHCYWATHLRQERELFEQAAQQHARLLVAQRLRKLFGFVPGSEDVKHFRIPSCQDWRDVSAPGLLGGVGDGLRGHYSFLGGQADEANEESTAGGIELKPRAETGVAQ